MSDLVGKTLSNRYQVIGLLGEGGMGGVYRAYDPVLSRPVAIKTMLLRYADKGDLLGRFQQEGRIAARLNHPGIVQVYDFGEVRGQYYIVMELIEGENLDQMMQRLRAKQQWIKLGEASALVRQVAAALAYAHGHGVVHRDIKPANIMLKELPLDELPYRPVVTDFGVAKLLEGGMQTQAGMTVGTPAYMSPEQTRGEELDSRSDVYSLGVLYYELAVGQLPFRIRSLTEAMQAHNYEAPPPPHTIRPDVPPAVEAIILKAMAKERSQRYASAAEFAEDLRQVSPTSMPETIPPGATMASTLLTQYRESLVVSRGLSMAPEIPGNAVREPQILVHTPAGEDNPIVIKSPRLTIGRVEPNDIVVRDDRVSRQHAVIQQADGRYTVTDLESLNGTYLGGERIPPKQPVPWQPGQPLRIGDHTLFLQLPGALTGASAASYAGTYGESFAGSASMADSLAGERGAAASTGPTLHVTVEPSELRVEPGKVVTLKATVANQSPTPQQVTLKPSGPASEWLTAMPPALSIPSGARQSVTLTLSPPRSAQIAPKRYPLTLQATAPGQRASATVSSDIAIQPYVEYRTKLVQPASGSSAEPWQVEIENKGNDGQRFQIVAQDPTDTLSFDPPQQSVRAEPGGYTYAQLRVKPRRRPLVGVGKSYPFQLRVQAEGGTAATHEGVYTRKPLIPAAISISLLVLFIAMVGGAWLLLNSGNLGVSSGSVSTAGVNSSAVITTTATPAATVLSAAQISMTAQAQAVALAANATQAATTATAVAQGTARAIATATAVWQVQDDDRDGLTNGEELALHTLPNNPDTDGDGINDGDETNLYRTNPLVKDTDGDGIPDGVEIQRGLNPLKADTDGDGLLDNVDPDPLRGPTATPTPTSTTDLMATATAVASMTVAANATAAEIAGATATAEFVALSAQQTRDAETAAQQAAQDQAAQTATAIVANANATAAAIQAMQNANATAQAQAAFATAQAATAAAQATHQAQQNQPTPTPMPTPMPTPTQPPQMPLHVEIVQTGAGQNGDSVSGALVFQAIAFDPNVGNQDGNGIDYVQMQIFKGNHKVYERKENNAAYCAFGGGEPDCNIWFFHDNNNQWPNGNNVEDGNYTLRARAHAHSGQEVTVQRQISISN